jgi:hypothetical protein
MPYVKVFQLLIRWAALRAAAWACGGFTWGRSTWALQRRMRALCGGVKPCPWPFQECSSACFDSQRHFALHNSRRRPFLVKGLEATLNKFILSLEFYDEEGRKKIAISGCSFGFLVRRGRQREMLCVHMLAASNPAANARGGVPASHLPVLKPPNPLDA